GVTGAQAQVNVANYQAAAGSAFLGLYHSRSGVIGTHAALLVNDPLGSVAYSGSDGTNFVKGAEITALCQIAPTTGRMPSRLVFFTDNNIGYAERIRIWPSGGTTFIGALFPISADPGAGVIEAEIRGKANASPGTAGCVGEYLTAQNVTSLPLTSGTAATLNSISLTAGDWDVWAKALWTTGGTIGNAEMELWTGTTISGTPAQYITQAAPGATVSFSVSMPAMRINVAATTTINLVGRSSVVNMG